MAKHEAEGSRGRNTKNSTKKSWLPLERIPANAATSSSGGSTKPIVYPLHVQMSGLEDRQGADQTVVHKFRTSA